MQLKEHIWQAPAFSWLSASFGCFKCFPVCHIFHHLLLSSSSIVIYMFPPYLKHPGLADPTAHPHRSHANLLKVLSMSSHVSTSWHRLQNLTGISYHCARKLHLPGKSIQVLPNALLLLVSQLYMLIALLWQCLHRVTFWCFYLHFPFH